MGRRLVPGAGLEGHEPWKSVPELPYGYSTAAEASLPESPDGSQLCTEPTMTEITATCGIAKLLVATLGGSLTDMFPQVGLELCPHCGSASNNPTTYPFCSLKHHTSYYRQAQAVPLICDECGIFFVRRKSEVMQWAKRGGQKIYCSNVCNGKFAGRTYGTAVNGAHAAIAKKGLATHCKRGHEFSTQNTYRWQGKDRTYRQCRTCRRDSKYQRYWHRKARHGPR